MVVKLVDFRGRTNRLDYVATIVLSALAFLLAAAVGHLLILALDLPMGAAAIKCLDAAALLGYFIGMIGAQSRRLRDIGLSPWHLTWILAVFGLSLKVSPVAYTAITMGYNLILMAAPRGAASILGKLAKTVRPGAGVGGDPANGNDQVPSSAP